MSKEVLKMLVLRERGFEAPCALHPRYHMRMYCPGCTGTYCDVCFSKHGDGQCSLYMFKLRRYMYQTVIEMDGVENFLQMPVRIRHYMANGIPCCLVHRRFKPFTKEFDTPCLGHQCPHGIPEKFDYCSLACYLGVHRSDEEDPAPEGEPAELKIDDDANKENDDACVRHVRKRLCPLRASFE